MFIIWKDFILNYHNNNLVRIGGDYKKISEKIIKSFNKNDLHISINNYYSSGKDKRDLYYIDSLRKRVFIVNISLLKKYGIHKIYKLLWGFTQNSFEENILRCQIYWPLPHFSKQAIKSEMDLIKNCFIIKSFDKKNSLYSFETYFSFGLWKYEWLYSWNIGGWVSNKKWLAKAKSISEAIERLSASITPTKMRFLTGKEFNWYTKKLFWAHWVSFHKNAVCKWFALWRQSKSIYIPTEILFYPYFGSIYGKWATSSGMATHMSSELAIQAWLLELIERDWFLLFWLLKSWFTKIDTATLPLKVQYLIQKNFKNYTVDIFSIKFDNTVPIILVTCRKESKTLIWLWCDFNFNNAISKALNELVYWKVFFAKPGKITMPWEVDYHTYYYLNKSNFHSIDRLFSQSVPVTSAQDVSKSFPPTPLQEILKQYSQNDISFYWYKYNNIINKYMNRTTCRVLSDALLPIYFEDHIPRYIRQNKRLLYWKETLKIKKVNSAIHPLG